MVEGNDDLMSGTSHLGDFRDTINGDSGDSARMFADIIHIPILENGTGVKSLQRSAPLVITHPIRQPLGNMPLPDVQSI